MAVRKVKKWMYVTGFFIFIAISYLFHWLSNRPDVYFDDIKLSFQGKIIEKYYYRDTHLKIEDSKKKIDIYGLTEELEEKANVGDSLIKYSDSNCCLLIKDNQRIKLHYKHLPDDVLERSEFLKKINKKACK